MTTDLDHKFELAVDLRHMAIAHAVLIEATAKVSVCNGNVNCFLPSLYLLFPSALRLLKKVFLNACEVSHMMLICVEYIYYL